MAEHTAGKIKDLIPPGVLDATTKLILTNAIYFKGNWAAQFDPKSTKEEPFTRADGSQVNAPLMHQTGEFGYLEQPDFQALDLPYAGNRLRMTILLPRKYDGLPELEKKLTPEALAGWLGQLSEQKVQVALPKFKLTSEFRLDDALRELGMRLAFRVGAADFSGMDGTQELYIGAVLHKAYVDVNEEGTEAAGATGVVMKMRHPRPAASLPRGSSVPLPDPRCAIRQHLIPGKTRKPLAEAAPYPPRKLRPRAPRSENVII